MSDESVTPEESEVPVDRVDGLVVELQRTWNDLRAKLAARHSQLSDDINAGVEKVSDKIDELQAAWEAKE